MPARYSTTAYRYPTEQIILVGTLALVLLVAAITAIATACISLLLIGFILFSSYFMIRAQHQSLLQTGYPVTPQSSPDLTRLVQINSLRLQTPPVEVFAVRNRTPNAYTFGLSTPQTIVLHSALFDMMDQDEIQFVLGHEMGHVKLGHAWLNSLIGGLAGVPISNEAALIMSLAFRSWNRACEYSADRAGMLACAKPEKALSALVKLEIGGNPRSQVSIEKAIQAIQHSEDNWMNDISELMYTHPIIAHRLIKLRAFAASPEYSRLQALMNQNLQ